MGKPIKRFHEAILMIDPTKRKKTPQAAFCLDSGGIEGGISSFLESCNFNKDGTLSRFETKNTIYVQVK